jgi:large subunit GTPase 1
MAPKKKQGSSLGRAVIKSRFQGQKAIALDEGKLVNICHVTLK